MKSFTWMGLWAALSLSPVAFADSHCKCDSKCHAACAEGNSTDCDCDSCDCKDSGHCKHDKDSKTKKPAPEKKAK